MLKKLVKSKLSFSVIFSMPFPEIFLFSQSVCFKTLE
jgi:hypothetical protein